MGTFRSLLRTAAAAALLSIPAVAAGAQPELPIIDTHVHYSQDAWKAYPPAAILKLFRESGVRHALVSSTPDDGTLKLFGASSKIVVPVLRPYREGTDLSDWFRNQSVFDYVSKRIERNIYRGIGEFHLQGNAESKTKQMRGIVALAVKRKIHLHVHSDATPIR
ncbi:MAG: amidohydrolase, partial [Proteobacteria bacterium]|nr:amidohydrolase [Pseudomonadota bacterium]